MSYIPPIPCTTIKCILYPVCQHKDHIECEHVGKYYRTLRNHFERNTVWENIKSFLPGMKSFRDGETNDPDYIYVEQVVKGMAAYEPIFGQDQGI